MGSVNSVNRCTHYLSSFSNTLSFVVKKLYDPRTKLTCDSVYRSLPDGKVGRESNLGAVELGSILGWVIQETLTRVELRGSATTGRPAWRGILLAFSMSFPSSLLSQTSSPKHSYNRYECLNVGIAGRPTPLSGVRRITDICILYHLTLQTLFSPSSTTVYISTP